MKGRALAMVVLLACGCALFRDQALEATLEYRESPLSAAALEKQMGEADRLYGEPRSVERVEKSLRICLDSISRRNGYQALWRGARATAWLAERHPDSASRERFARLGMEIGKEAVKLAPDEASSHYFHALNIGHLSSLEGSGLRRVPVMEERTKKTIELDEEFEYAGGHRFLGLLHDETKDYPLAAIGTFEDAVEHLERACELFPDYGYNLLCLAEVLIAEEEDEEEALSLLQRVIASPVPPDESLEHSEWVTRAEELMAKLKEDS